MLSMPWTHSPAATVREVAHFFGDEHVHAALIVSPAGYLAAIVERSDLAAGAAPDTLAMRHGRLDGRTVAAEASLAETRLAMIAAGRRRTAVISADGRLLGLLCMKASGAGFCSDQDVLARRRSADLASRR
jgi:CBS domain-containing protein